MKFLQKCKRNLLRIKEIKFWEKWAIFQAKEHKNPKANFIREIWSHVQCSSGRSVPYLGESWIIWEKWHRYGLSWQWLVVHNNIYHPMQIFLPLIGWEPSLSYKLNNCLQIMVCSCAMSSNCVWLCYGSILSLVWFLSSFVLISLSYITYQKTKENTN